MNIFILSCGVFEPELNKILKEIKEEKIFEQDIEVKYLPFGLHTNLNKLKYEITANLDKLKSYKVILLYGSKCHYKFYEFITTYREFFDENNKDIDTKGVPDFEAIIDGQQRLTTIMLLLRAFHVSFGNMQDENSKRIREMIESCVWKTDEFGYADKTKLKIDSEVATDKDKDEFLSIFLYE